jgi:pilus assembly protein CpaF
MEGQIVTLQDLFKFEQAGVGEDGAILGSMAATGIRPTFSERFEAAGVSLPADLFLAGMRR